MTIQDKHVLITGASGTLGQAMTRCLLDEGAYVTAQCFRHPEILSSLLQEDQEYKQRLRVVITDLTNTADIHDLFERLQHDSSHLDILINNAGGAKPHHLWELTAAEWQECLQLNLTAPFLCLQFALPLLKQSCGCVINISSVAGLTGGTFGPHYAAVKAGLIGLTRNAARELGRYGIRVNAIAPGAVESPMTRSLDQAVLTAMLKETALQHVVQPDEIAEAVVWLSSAKAISGQTVVIDAGRYFL